MDRRNRILIVDDEPAIREMFAEYLTLHGFDTETCDGGAALRARLDGGAACDVMLLDVTMPGEDGLSLARWMRESHGPGVIMVTARGDAIDRIVGLEIGADDYLAKPVDLRELLARVRALLRRLDDRAEAPALEVAAPARRIAIGTMTLDLDARRLTDGDGRDIGLTAMEFDLLAVLAARPDRVLSRDQLLDLAHKDPEAPFDRSIDIRVARLRRKIERDPARPEIIRTVRGVGYVFSRKPS